MGKRLQKREVNFEQDAYGIFRLSILNLSKLFPYLNFLMLFSFIRVYRLNVLLSDYICFFSCFGIVVTQIFAVGETNSQ